ncbi:MAG: HEAT repeat domain-containing protein [Candidatus Eremiobacteraeota bacterium]|nr:HEAT repeat domain-containing protein [Candidatus Eremiobacteraeota bacterium]
MKARRIVLIAVFLCFALLLSFCAWAVEKSGSGEDMTKIKSQLKAQDEATRIIAVQILLKEGKDAIPILTESLLGSPYKDVRIKIAEGLGNPQFKNQKVVAQTLIKALGDGEAIVRASAATSLKKIGIDKSLIPMLVNAMKTNPYPDVKASMTEVLGKYGMEDVRALQALSLALNDKDSGVRTQALEAISRGGTSAIPILVMAIEESKYLDVVSKAVESLGHFAGDKRVIKPLLKVLTDDKSRAFNITVPKGSTKKQVQEQRRKQYRVISENAAKSLIKTGSTGINALIDELEEERSRKHASVWAMGIVKSNKFVSHLDKVIMDENVPLKTRAQAIKSIKEIGHRMALEPLTKVLKSEEGSLRLLAVIALKDFRDVNVKTNKKTGRPTRSERATEAVPELIFVLENDEMPEIRKGASMALIAIDDKRGIKPLIKAFLADPAINEIGFTFTCNEVPMLISLLKPEKALNERFVAAKALGVARDNRAVMPLISALKNDKEPSVRLRVAESLGQIGDRRAVRSLGSALEDENKDVREAVLKSLETFKDKSAPEFIRALKSDYPDVVKSAANTLGRLKSIKAIKPMEAALRENSRDVRVAILESLGAIGKPACPAILEVFKEYKDDTKLRTVAAHYLGTLQYKPAIVPMLKALRKDEELKPKIVVNRRYFEKKHTSTSKLFNVETTGSKKLGGDAPFVLLVPEKDYFESLVSALGKIGSKSTMPVANLYGETNNPGMKLACLQILYRIETGSKTVNKKAESVIKDALKDENSSVKTASALIVGSLPTLKSNNRLIKILSGLAKKSDVFTVKMASIWTNGASGRVDEAKTLIATLRGSKDEFVRAASAYGLGRLGNKRAVQSLIDSAENDESKKVRLIAIKALAALDDESAVNPLKGIVSRDKDIDVRIAALQALTVFESPVVIRSLIAFMKKDKSEKIRNAATRALGQLKSESAINALINVLKTDKSESLRSSAAWALGEIRNPLAIKALIGAIKDNSSYVRYNAIRSLGTMGEKRASRAVLGALEDSDPKIRIIATEVLVELNAESAVRQLTQLLDDREPAVRMAAAWALGKLKGGKATLKLINALNDKKDFTISTSMRSKYLDSVKSILSKAYGGDLNGPHPYNSIMSALALGEIGSRRAISPIKKLYENATDSGVKAVAKKVLMELVQK